MDSNSIIKAPFITLFAITAFTPGSPAQPHLTIHSAAVYTVPEGVTISSFLSQIL